MEVLDRYKGRTGTFMKKFLIDNTFNSNDWKVTDEAIGRDLKSFIGQPTVLVPDPDDEYYLDHPPSTIQGGYSIGDIIDVGYDEFTRKAWQVTHVTDDHAAELIRTKQVRYGSPQVATPMNDVEYVDRGTPNEKTILHSMRGQHDAIVADPAYGTDKDNIKAICDGDGVSCATKLMEVQASLSDAEIGQITIPQFIRKVRRRALINLAARLACLEKRFAS